jgi:hypothetical protein
MGCPPKADVRVDGYKVLLDVVIELGDAFNTMTVTVRLNERTAAALARQLQRAAVIARRNENALPTVPPSGHTTAPRSGRKSGSDK